MTYKFQRGAARLSGSIVQLSGSTDINATTVDSLDVDTDGISIGGIEVIDNTLAVKNVTTVSGSGNFSSGGSLEIAGSGSVNGGDLVVTAGNISASNGWISASAGFVGDGSNLQNVTVTPAGSNTEIQFNADNSSGASANLTFNTGSNTLTTVNIESTTLSASADLEVGGNITGSTINVGSVYVTSGDIDVATAGNLNIGATVGANTITIGANNSVIEIAGNLIVNGTSSIINSEIQTADASLLMNVDYTGASIQNGYVIWNTDPDPATTAWTGTNYNIFIENKASIKFYNTNLGGVTQFDNISNGDLLLMKGNPNTAENGIWEIKTKGTSAGSSYIVIKSPNATNPGDVASPSSDVADFVLDDITNYGSAGGTYLPSEFEIVLIKVTGIKTDSANDKMQLIYGSTGGSMTIQDFNTGAVTSTSGSIIYSGATTIVTSALTASNSITLVDTTTSAFSIELPDIGASDLGKQFIIKDQGGNCGTNALTINKSSANELIDGDGFIKIESDYGSVTLVATQDGGTKGYVVV